MNLRCGFCQTPYALSRTEMLAALQHLENENLTHYDAQCPRCRRSTPILRRRLELALPNWKEELKQAVAQPAPEPIQPAQAKPKLENEEVKAAHKKPSARPASQTQTKPKPRTRSKK